MNNQVIQTLPELEMDESLFIQQLVGDFSDAEIQQFAILYRAQRKEPQTILLCTLVGFVSVAGIQRFILGQIGMGILYLFTGGLCFIGTIMDIINHKKLSFEYNSQQAQQIAGMMRAGI